MTRTLVALDLETTGLQVDRDAILEIGAVRFRGDEVLDTFSTLVNPQRPIPFKITQLTGISDRDVQGAPMLQQVLPRLVEFVGSVPVIGHNVAFDLGFLNRHEALKGHVSMDTFEIAGILVPHAARYSLEVLARTLGVDAQVHHRALDDAHTTHRLFTRLFERAAALDIRLIQEINKLAAASGWALRAFFRDVEESRARSPRIGRSLGQQVTSKAGEDTDALGVSLLVEDEWAALRPLAEKQVIDAGEISALLEPGGVFERDFPHYEYRPQQVEMLGAVAQALNEGYHLLAEAGTGTGKSLAYLLPAAYFAVRNQRPVVVSTNTINLQEQLYLKDIPDLQRMVPLEFQVALLKGRSNYLCMRRLNAMRQRQDLDVDELRVLARVLIWQRSTATGDEGELLLPNARERAVWRRLSSEADSCLAEVCPHRQRGRCFFYRARRRAERAHIIIVNHALLLSDVAVENRVLPEYKHLIIDEAHHLENAITRQLSFDADTLSMDRMLSEVSHSVDGRRPGGTLADVLAACRSPLTQPKYRELEEYVGSVRADVDAAQRLIHMFFQGTRAFMDEYVQASEEGGYDRRLRVTDGIRAQPGWSDVEIAWENCSVALTRVSRGLEGLYDRLEAVEEFDIPEMENLLQDLTAHILRIRSDRDQMTHAVSEPSGQGIYWLEENNQTQLLSLHSAPLHVGELMRKTLFDAKETVILTSATLQTSGAFDYIRERLSAWDSEELAVGSPFDWKSSTLLFLPTDVPEPRSPGYQRAVETALFGLCKATEGRTLILFTSYSQLRTTARAIAPQLAEQQITVLEQGDGTSRQQLLQTFRTVPRTVLMGTRSFWEGIDVMGEALSCLAIVRLPFSVPTDPIFAARSETFEDPFNQYSVPETVLRFRQGFGRLIRSRTDRGVAVVLDSRLVSKQYGQAFLDSLPDCTVYRGLSANLPRMAGEWLKVEQKEPQQASRD